MAGGPYALGIDYGTGGVRIGIFDVEGHPAVFHSVEFPTAFPRPGRAEQDPRVWWSSLVEAVGGALRESGVATEEIAGIGIDTTGATLAMDADDEPGTPSPSAPPKKVRGAASTRTSCSTRWRRRSRSAPTG